MKRTEYTIKMRMGIKTNPAWMLVDGATNPADAKALMEAHEKTYPCSTFRLSKVTTEILEETEHE